ncbi:MAG: Asp-tRNA(Asn)/Glu-tRNA(Gln) amidotransferase subunit GatB [Rhabdochlamydiaceae bacterium]|nr:Asp-tRNA(Asn)/Glu-tRNA(Gln) amidotransferase subunit GatB [Candidatus Amphrikana amoebophyrae]
MTNINYEEWEPVIGLEIHAQLDTKTKMFSRAPNRYGDEPNTNISIADTGQPGALPVINGEAVKKAVMFGLAIDADIALTSQFDRKSYFYPDNPRNFQITQFEFPIVRGGVIEADVDGKTKRFDIHHAHLEDDTGMLKHFSKFTGIDYNRAGAPLIEIVSMPCMRSPGDAVAYAMALRSVMQYVGTSNCNMDEGSMRIDVNISVRKKGEKGLRTKVEIKNMNSFSNMAQAIESEFIRQVALYVNNPDTPHNEVVHQSTCRFDLETKQTVVMRVKETADDYRYFPEPDLPPLVLTKEYIEEIKHNIPELPHERYKRYVKKLKIGEYSATLLINDKALSDEYEEALKHTTNARSLCNWLTVEFVGRIKESGKSLSEFGIKAKNVADLVNLIESEVITGRIAKQVADDMVQNPSLTPEEIVKANPNYQPIKDAKVVEDIIDKVLAANPSSIEDFHGGKDRAFNYLVGQVMKETKGKASPDMVKEMIKAKIGDQ